jgi:hypothetical protein
MLKNFVSILIVSVCLFITANAQKTENVSLIVKYSLKNSNSDSVVSLDFANGKFIGKRVLFTVDRRVAGTIGEIVLDRYIMTNNETIYGWKPQNEKTFDLVTGKFVERSAVPIVEKPENERYDIVSPDGKKRVKRNGVFGGVDKLTIAIEGQKDLIINEPFDVTTRETSSFIPYLPIRWLDNERILTQKTNGSLVVITLDGKVTPFLEIPCSTEESPAFRFTKAGKLSYLCGREEYRIDVEKKSFARIKHDLDYDFSYDFENKEKILFYNDEKIGEGGFAMETFSGYFATTDGKPSLNGFYDASDINQVRIWNRFNKQWHTITLDGWHAQMLGWIAR